MVRLARMILASILLLASSCVFAEPININTADTTVLTQGMKGIGQAKAEAIIAYRNEHGGFKSVDELTNVKGIGEAILEQNRENLTIGTAPSAADK